MATYAKVPLPRWSGRTRADLRTLGTGIAEWASSTPMRDLVECFDEKWPTGNTAEVLAELDEISARRWDFRNGKERASMAVAHLDPTTAEGILAAVAALGLMGERIPGADFYDHVLIHGGLLRGCLVRARFAADLVRTAIRSPEVCGLGSFRPTTEEEAAIAAQLGIGACPDEFTAMDIAVRAAFDLVGPGRQHGSVVPVEPNSSELTKEYRGPGGMRIGVIAAASRDPVRRANTADTCTFWAESFADPRPGEKLLLVTTDLFVPFQHCDAIRVLGLPYGCSVETIGLNPAGVADGRLRQELNVANYLQEVRSAIRSMRALFSDVQTR